MGWYIKVLKDYAVFTGRARRKEYWFFFFFNIIISFVLGFIDGLFGMFLVEQSFGLLSGIYTLAVLVPSLAVSVRRLHDTNRSGWWLLIAFVPVIGAIVLIVFFILDSEPGSNSYGPNPKTQEAAL